jgi:subtilase family serine protease
MASGFGRWMGVVAAGLAICAVAGFSAVATAPAAGSRSRVGSASRLPSGAQVTGAIAASQRLELSIALEPRDPGGLQSFAAAVSTPGSPQFRHYLSVSQFADTYGATAAQIAGVESTLTSDGLTVGRVMADHLTLAVSGTAAQVQQAFATKLAQVKLAGGGSAYANTVAPTVASSVAGDIQAVVGLNDLAIPKPAGLARPAGTDPRLAAPSQPQPNVASGGPHPCPSATDAANAGGGTGYTADTIAAAYRFSSLYGVGDLGAGQTVALYELAPYNSADIADYQSCYGTSAAVTNVAVDGGPEADPSGATEAELDIEQAVGLAPGARILVYEAPNTEAGAIDNYAAIVSQDRAGVVSSSWGSCEPTARSGGLGPIDAENTLLEEAAAQGQSVYAASGDSGSAACAQAMTGDGLAVEDPSSQPFATGVGGTTLFTTKMGQPDLWSPGQPLEESVWNDGSTILSTPGASAGGISEIWPMPAYQAGAPHSVGVINPNSSGAPCGQAPDCREVPDVSADGDPLSGYVVFESGTLGPGWEVLGGTSAAAPLWAAYTALVNDYPACRGVKVGFVNPALYRIAGSAYANNISDVTLASPITGAANNDALGTNGGLYPVTSGYDMATGLGTPISPTLANSLCTIDVPAFTVTVADPGSQTGVVGTPTSLRLRASDSGAAALTYSASGLPAGLTLGGANGLISGTPTTAGVYAVTVAAADTFGNAGSTRFTWTIFNPLPTQSIKSRPRIKSLKLSGIGRRKPKLTFTATAGHNAPALKSLTVSLPKGLSFATKIRTLAKGIRARGVKFKLRIHRGALTISFTSMVRSVSVQVETPAISDSAGLASMVRRHKLKRLTVAIVTTDASRTPFKTSVTVTKLG